MTLPSCPRSALTLKAVVLLSSLALSALSACGGGGGGTGGGTTPTAQSPAVPAAAPDTRITGGPSASTTETSAIFNFVADPAAGASFRCALDGAAATACGSPHMVSGLALGTRRMVITASNAGGSDPTPATHVWTIASPPPPPGPAAPDTRISSGPPASTTETSATFSFVADPASGASFRCALDGTAAVACSSPHTVSGLAAGTHRMLITASNAGGADPTPAVHDWTITAPPPPTPAAPDTRITSGPPASTAETSASFGFAADPANGASFRCALDGAASATCTSPHTVSGLATGTHRMVVTASNAGGDDATPATHDWTITAPPTTPPPTTSAYSSPNAPLGINLFYLVYYSPEWPFIDLFRTAREWFTSNTNTFDTREQAQLPRDARGWVTRLPAANDSTVQYRFLSNILFGGARGHYPAGDYVVLYDGEGTLDYRADARRVDALSSPGRDVFRVATPTDQGIHIRIMAINPANHLRNLRVIMPGYQCNGDAKAYCATLADCDAASGGRTACVSLERASASQLFHPKFLSDVSRFRAIRAIHYFNANANGIERWDQRTPFDAAIWVQGFTPPLEILPLMGNAAGTDIWVNEYIRADDDFVRQHARMVRDTLRAPFKAHIELSNEVWNGVEPYRQDGLYARERGNARWPGQLDEFRRQWNWYGLRSQEVCRIWKQEWGAEAARVQCVMGSQVGVRNMHYHNLACPLYTAEAAGNAACSRDMSLAIAPYFGNAIGHPSLQPQVEQWTSDADGGLTRLFREINTGGELRDLSTGQPIHPEGALGQVRREIGESSQEARAQGVPLIAYEGGQHIIGGNGSAYARTSPLFLAGQRDARMAQAHDALLADWRAAGGERFMFFQLVDNFDEFGAFGLKEGQTDDNAPKWRGILDYLARTPCWWTSCGN